MKIDDKVKAFVKDKYLPGIVQRVEDCKGFRRQYDYQKIWVEFEDESVLEFRGYDVIPIHAKEKGEPEVVKEKKKLGRPKKQ